MTFGDRPVLRDKRAVAAIEFAIVGNVFFTFFFCILFNGLNGLYQATLDDAVRSTARQMQVGGPASTSSNGFVNAVCGVFSAMASDCSGKITYSVQSATPAAGFATMTPAALSASGTFANSFFSGAPRNGNVDLLIQVAYPLPFSLPFSTYFTGTGLNVIKAIAVVRMEPL